MKQPNDETLQSLSVVIPVYNEEPTLEALAKGIREATSDRVGSLEIIFVDDGSTDRSFCIAREMSRQSSDVRVIRLAVNSGKAEALSAGFECARGDVVITMDADLQDDPCEIPRFLDELAGGYDLVSGWKEHRQDPWHKTWPSRLFNTVTARLFNIPLHDFNCGFKAYRASLVKRLHLYGELHRYVPVLARHLGARLSEIPVQHHPRRYGHSKYGAERLVKGFLDMLTVLVITRFLKRPLHLFGMIGTLFSLAGGFFLTYLGIIWLWGVRPIGNRPLLFYGMALLILGIQFLSLGVVAELFIHFNQRTIKPMIAEQVGFDQGGG